MLGKEDEFEIIKKLLTELGSKEKKVVSIIGMGGIGKTTLARRVYKDPSICTHFDLLAWAVASQLHNKRQMLVSLLISITSQLQNKRQMLVNLLNSISKQDMNIEEFSDDVLALKLYQCKGISDDVLALELYQCLKRQRYMVVIDDVWSGEAWDDVSNCFSDDRNGSRVLLTTRLIEVANYTSSDNDFSHQMQLLDQSDSWNLFREKASKSRSAEFEIIGRPIVEKCKGLPLAIIVVAGLFSKLNTLNEWENMAKTLDSSTMTTVAATCSTILSLSYNHLPHYLKACFLYLGVFPEDYAINANELARLWSAEGLVKASENEDFDVVADRRIQELMDRNLIFVSKWSCCGRKIKLFGLHDLLHAFCVKEAHKENLLHVVRENGLDFPRSFRWLSIQSSNFDIFTVDYNSKWCKSFFCFIDDDLSYLCRGFSKLRVFFTLTHYVWFVGRTPTGTSPYASNLRYLPRPSTWATWALLSGSILHTAWNLQTVYARSDFECDYLEFPQLQYLYCRALTFEQHPKFIHQNLQRLSKLGAHQCTKEFVTHFPNIKKLWITGYRETNNDCIENLANLQQLEKLIINASWRKHSMNSHIALLKNLKKLRFKSTKFEWNTINVLCKLPRLEVLKLIEYACEGKEWELQEDDKFCQLIFLGIDFTDLKDWKATGDNFSKLEHLSVSNCKKLKEIPSGFAEISRLKSIQLKNCRPSVVASAEKIKEEQLDYLNNIVDVACDGASLSGSESESDEA